MQLLDCFGIPVLMALSWFILYARYRVVHFIAVAVSLLGVGTMVGADILAERKNDSGKNVLLVSPVQSQQKIVLRFSLLFFEDIVKGRKHVLVNCLFNIFLDLLASGVVTTSTKHSLCTYLLTVLVPFCHTSFVS